MTWGKGKSGNEKGLRRNQPFFDALNRAIKQDDGVRLRQCAEQLLTLAAAGEQWATEMLAERLDGKVATRVENADGEPFAIEVVRRVLVRPQE